MFQIICSLGVGQFLYSSLNNVLYLYCIFVIRLYFIHIATQVNYLFLNFWIKGGDAKIIGKFCGNYSLSNRWSLILKFDNVGTYTNQLSNPETLKILNQSRLSSFYFYLSLNSTPYLYRCYPFHAVRYLNMTQNYFVSNTINLNDPENYWVGANIGSSCIDFVIGVKNN